LDYIEVKVECYSGYKADERPVAFTYQGNRLEVKEIVDRWYEGDLDGSKPVIDYFRVRDRDGNIYLLRYQRYLNLWSLLETD
jgi:hypothetical protein